MCQMIIIAGPQAAGKSTVIEQVRSQSANMSPLFSKRKTPLFFPLQESRQIIVHRHMLLGAIFMNPAHETEVVSCDLDRMDQIFLHDQKHTVYLDECNIFTLAHAAAHGVSGIWQYWDEYLVRLKKLDAAVIFLDVPPDVSWDRRRQRYEERLVYFPRDQHQSILERYSDYLQTLHPLLLDVYDRLPFPKEMINGCSSGENVLKEVCRKITDLTEGLST